MPTLVSITTNHIRNEYIFISSLEEIPNGISPNLVSELIHTGPKCGLLCRSSEYNLLLWKQ